MELPFSWPRGSHWYVPLTSCTPVFIFPLGDEWKDFQAAKDMSEVLRVRGTVPSPLEKSRGEKQVSVLSVYTSCLFVFSPRRLKSSLEAIIDLIVPDGTAGTELIELLSREGSRFSLFTDRL